MVVDSDTSYLEGISDVTEIKQKCGPFKAPTQYGNNGALLNGSRSRYTFPVSHWNAHSKQASARGVAQIEWAALLGASKRNNPRGCVNSVAKTANRTFAQVTHFRDEPALWPIAKQPFGDQRFYRSAHTVILPHRQLHREGSFGESLGT
jgi:hypothetical protein